MLELGTVYGRGGAKSRGKMPEASSVPHTQVTGVCESPHVSAGPLGATDHCATSHRHPMA